MKLRRVEHVWSKGISVGTAVILGAGDGIGGAIARRFSEGGDHVVIVRRDLNKANDMAPQITAAGGSASAANTDVREPEAVEALFRSIEDTTGPIDTCVYNAGANTNKPLLETTPKLFRQVWELACFGGFLAARECARHMVPRGRGSLLFTSATSGVVARTGYAAFASAKFGLRAVAQASARELGPAGVHVAHVIIDCAVSTDAIRERFAKRGIDIDDMAPDTLAQPESIAEQYWMLSRQPRDAWTHELDLRPYAEKW